ncbi:hypothetical protein CEXT_226021 [Caerostris extrusa]|uniref:Uncharacterized protein n=1 Tax=Caerostris extrusa TaxID=172846 RepID=A0AAV4Y0G8_CAEEX|nr:hypothetical protein CEXT_226021 [Caerostris extrusa]
MVWILFNPQLQGGELLGQVSHGWTVYRGEEAVESVILKFNYHKELIFIDHLAVWIILNDNGRFWLDVMRDYFIVPWYTGDFILESVRFVKRESQTGF